MNSNATLKIPDEGFTIQSIAKPNGSEKLRFELSSEKIQKFENRFQRTKSSWESTQTTVARYRLAGKTTQVVII